MNEFVKDILSGNEKRARIATGKLKGQKAPELISQLLPIMVDWEGAPSTPAEYAAEVISSLGENAQVCDYLIEKLDSGDSSARESAAWALSNAPQEKAVPTLKRIAAGDVCEAVQIWSLHALKVLGWQNRELEKDFLEVFFQAAESSLPGVRCAALECLCHIDDRRCDKYIEDAKNDADPQIREVHAPTWIEQRKGMCR